MFYLRELSRPADERVNEGGANRERQLHAVNVAVVLEDGLVRQARERRFGSGRDAQEQPRRRVEVEPLDSLFRDARNYNIGVARRRSLMFEPFRRRDASGGVSL
jgi:hypothetical protein